MTLATSQDGLDVTPEGTAAFINMSGELLQSLTTKDGIIELHVLKDETELLDTEDTTVEEVIHAD
uniref:Uncharacterized protein n=1 Tax=Arion vulgaris TaxID=1028688 RepID=A0A0B6YWG2_9EUPU